VSVFPFERHTGTVPFFHQGKRGGTDVNLEIVSTDAPEAKKPHEEEAVGQDMTDNIPGRRYRDEETEQVED